MRSWALAVAVAACGGSAPQPEAPIAAPREPPPTTCADAGVILRGSVDDSARAGAARETAIAAACTADKWSPAVLACVAASRKPVGCLDRLTHAQHADYDARIAHWSDEYGGDSYGGGVDAAAVHRTTECSAVANDAGGYPPLIDANAPEHDWDVVARKRAVVEACESGQWREDTKACLADGDRPEGCLYEEPNHDTLEIELKHIDELAAKIAAAKKKPASIDCKLAAASWYSDAHWKAKLAPLKPAERTKQLAAARAAMQKACSADSWTETMRACIVADGGEPCFDFAHLYADAWSLPPVSLALPANTPRECADYSANIQRLLTCDKLPQAARDAMKQGRDAMAAGWATLAPDARLNTISACKAANDSVVQTGKAACNW